MRAREPNTSNDNVTQFFSAWESPAMRGIQSLMAEIALTDIPILVVGETGSGRRPLPHRFIDFRHGETSL